VLKLLLLDNDLPLLLIIKSLRRVLQTLLLAGVSSLFVVTFMARGGLRDRAGDLLESNSFVVGDELWALCSTGANERIGQVRRVLLDLGGVENDVLGHLSF
jgi:hypothetical protein